MFYICNKNEGNINETSLQQAKKKERKNTLIKEMKKTRRKYLILIIEIMETNKYVKQFS